MSDRCSGWEEDVDAVMPSTIQGRAHRNPASGAESANLWMNEATVDNQSAEPEPGGGSCEQCRHRMLASHPCGVDDMTSDIVPLRYPGQPPNAYTTAS